MMKLDPEISLQVSFDKDATTEILPVVSSLPPPAVASLSSLSLSSNAVSFNSTDDSVNQTCCGLLQPQRPQQRPTNMLYMTYDGNFLTECRSTIVDVVPMLSSPAPSVINNEPKKESSDLIVNSSSSSKNHHPVYIVLDRTVMHAQGGGQPTDIGQIQVIRPTTPNINMENSNDELVEEENDNETNQTDVLSNPNDTSNTTSTTIEITKVELDRTTGIVKHYGTILPEETEINHSLIRGLIGNMVQVQVNAPQRQLLSECHTAGHVVDAAMIQCGFHFQPSKGYHFLDSPYVEYYYNNPQNHNSSNNNNNNNTVTTINEKQDLSKLQHAFQQLLQQDIPTKIELLSKEEAHLRCNAHMDEPWFDMDLYGGTTSLHDPTVRIVTVAGYACPCGGTHVRRTGELLRTTSTAMSSDSWTWNITGIKCKPKGYVRIKYGRTILNEMT